MPPQTIDASAFTRKQAMELTDLALGRTPHQPQSELAKLFEGDRSKPSTIERHRRCTEWVRQNLTMALRWFWAEGQRKALEGKFLSTISL